MPIEIQLRATSPHELGGDILVWALFKRGTVRE